MAKYILRLDDACPKMDIDKWLKMEELCDKYNVKPLVGIIPNCKDPDMDKYQYNYKFWDETVKRWESKGWELALHGYNHVFETTDGGINPVNNRSEFAGLSLKLQKEKIFKGLELLKEYGIVPRVFFAPAHTFDNYTIIALKESESIKIISDYPSYDSFYENGMYYVPQQSGKVRRLPFKTITFCYHPNNMTQLDFDELECFLKRNKFSVFDDVIKRRKRNVLDKIIFKLYFLRKKR